MEFDYHITSNVLWWHWFEIIQFEQRKLAADQAGVTVVTIYKRLDSPLYRAKVHCIKTGTTTTAV